MFNLLFPIFCFGLVISGIVFLGLQQASDLAKYSADQAGETKPASATKRFNLPGGSSDPTKELPAVTRR